MEGNNTAPFSEGQKIVALKSSRCGTIVRDKVYTAAFCTKCEKCKVWHVGIKEVASEADSTWCGICSGVVDHSGYSYGCGRAIYFVPYEKRNHEISIDKEIWDSLPKETEETVDPFVLKPQEASVQNQLLDTIDEMIALLPQIPIEQRFAYADKIVEAINSTCKLIRGE